MTAPACKTYATERLSAFVDGDLPPGEAAAVRSHAAGCATCTTTIEELRALVTEAHALGVRSAAARGGDGVCRGRRRLRTVDREAARPAVARGGALEPQ